MSRTCAVCVAVCVAAVVGAVPASAGGPDYDSIADKLVNQLAEIQPGEVVVIQGTLDQQPLLEALVVAVSIPAILVFWPL